MMQRHHCCQGRSVSVVPADVIAAKVGQAVDNAVADFGTLSPCFT